MEIIRTDNGINILHSKKIDDVYDVLALINENWIKKISGNLKSNKFIVYSSLNHLNFNVILTSDAQ
jgi:hypothetical protein